MLNVQEIAAQLRVHQRTVLREIKRGHFPGAFRVGRVWRIPASDLRAYVERRRGHQVSAPEE